MTSSEIRNSFLKFFEQRKHTIVSSSPVIPFEDPTLLFTNAGMNQFKDVFLGNGKRSYSRAVDTQKCIRVSGKHNDLEEVGRDTYHHTFFEMLGNWSFGDPSEPDGIGRAGYYKKEAVEWAWELLTQVWKLPKDRLWVTVYNDDKEAEQLWKSVTNIDPSHVLQFGEKDNFWEMGETGPCGPCSEIHIDRTPTGNATSKMINAGTPDVIEIWNLVFIQYNRDENGKLSPLPAKHVDTGMGFERICAVLQGKNSNYDTDVFSPIICKISELAHKPYTGGLQSEIGNSKFEIDTAMRVIADHVRTLTFAIGDGAIPSNEGRGYVLRRILRRAARFGRNLGMHEPFIYKLVPILVETMGDIFPEIKSNQEHIQKAIKGEEEGFNATLDRGLKLFENEAFTNALSLSAHNNGIQVIRIAKAFEDEKQPSEIEIDDMEFIQNGHSIGTYTINELHNGAWRQVLKGTPSISGDDAFKLYDTYGFPLDLTEMMASERGLKVDTGKFHKLMEEQRSRSRWINFKLPLNTNKPNDPNWLLSKQRAKEVGSSPLVGMTKFVGYEQFNATAKVLAATDYLVWLDNTPCYAESGGQEEDTGIIYLKDEKIEIIHTQKVDDVIVHTVLQPNKLKERDDVKVEIDIPRRLSIMRNHSATHLLHNALRRILGTHVQQSGSLVAPDYLRFDFTHFSKLTEKELADIEALVNEKIKENIPRTPNLNNIPFEDAKKMGALMFFGEKYGERVNVIQFGDFSTEFCGGTHVNNTGEIGYFKIRSEGSIASGVRRIEAVTNNYALEYLKTQEKNYLDRLDETYQYLDELSKLKIEIDSASNGESELAHYSFNGYEQRLEDLKKITHIPDHASQELAVCFGQLANRNQALEEFLKNLTDERKSFEKELARFRLKSLSGSMDELIASAVTINSIKLVAAKVSSTSMDELKSLGDALRSKLGSGVGLLASVIEDKVQLVCVVTDDLVAAKKIEAGKVIGAIAKLVGGGGGGRPHMATAGGKDITKLDEAIKQTRSIIESLLRK
jgi:alanyl-tRNA synthetase